MKQTIDKLTKKELVKIIEDKEMYNELDTFEFEVDNKKYICTKKQQQNNVLFKDIEIPKGFRLIKATEIMKFWDNKQFKDSIMKANNNSPWFFVKNLDCYKKDFVALFDAGSDRSYLSCDGDPQDSDSSVGVIFVREMIENV